MKFFPNFNRINQIESEIFDIKNEIFNLPKKMDAPVAQSVLDGRVTKAEKPLLNRLDLLKTERDFLISRREAFLPKTIWNLIVPVIASVLTAIIVTSLKLK